jgi:hypothetical protein
LHKLLEKPEVAVVGISNWTLDLAKMNRAVRLTRAEPSIDDLKLTAMGIVSNQHLEGSLRSLAEVPYLLNLICFISNLCSKGLLQRVP